MTFTAPEVILRHGAAMPGFGLGTWPMDDKQAESAVLAAIEAGYRLFDTAESYGNEKGVGRGLKASGVPREQLFVTTKFNRRWHGVDLVARAFERSAGRLGLDYVDLMLIHWPNPAQDRYVDAWRGLAALLDSGRVRAIGTSNFKPAHLQRLMDETGVLPDVNQIELNPSVTRAAAREFHRKHGIVTESWGPIGGAGNRLLRQPAIIEVAGRLGKTPAQVVLRWHVQLGVVAIPKSSNPLRLAENIDIFSFELPPDDFEVISALDRGEAAATDSDAYGH